MANSLSSNFYQSLMQPGELLLWHGAPGPGKLSSYGQVPILFSIIWLGFSLVWEAAAIMSGVIIMILFGLPFVLIGLSIAFGGPIRNARLKGKIFYAVTDQRLLIQEGNEVSIYTPDMLPPMQIHMNKNGTGSIFSRRPTTPTEMGTSTTVCAPCKTSLTWAGLRAHWPPCCLRNKWDIP